MLRLPHLRDKLAEAAAPAIMEIFEDYDLAVSTRDAFLSDPPNSKLAEEYDQFCRDLEIEAEQKLLNGSAS